MSPDERCISYDDLLWNRKDEYIKVNGDRSHLGKKRRESRSVRPLTRRDDAPNVHIYHVVNPSYPCYVDIGDRKYPTTKTNKLRHSTNDLSALANYQVSVTSASVQGRLKCPDGQLKIWCSATENDYGTIKSIGFLLSRSWLPIS